MKHLFSNFTTFKEAKTGTYLTPQIFYFLFFFGVGKKLVRKVHILVLNHHMYKKHFIMFQEIWKTFKNKNTLIK